MAKKSIFKKLVSFVLLMLMLLDAGFSPAITALGADDKPDVEVTNETVTGDSEAVVGESSDTGENSDPAVGSDTEGTDGEADKADKASAPEEAGAADPVIGEADEDNKEDKAGADKSEEEKSDAGKSEEDNKEQVSSDKEEESKDEKDEKSDKAEGEKSEESARAEAAKGTSDAKSFDSDKALEGQKEEEKEEEKAEKPAETAASPDAADYVFTQDVVYLKDILDALNIAPGNNYELTLSVDSDVLSLSETTLKNKNRDDITLTAFDYFDFAVLTMSKNKDVITVTLAYPEPVAPVIPSDDAITLTAEIKRPVEQNTRKGLSKMELIGEVSLTGALPKEGTLNVSYAGDIIPGAVLALFLGVTDAEGGAYLPAGSTVTLRSELIAEAIEEELALEINKAVIDEETGKPVYTTVSDASFEKDAAVFVADELESDGKAVIYTVSVAAREDKIPETAIPDIKLVGNMPANAVVDIQRTVTMIENRPSILSFDITIYANEKQKEKNRPWQPAGKKVQVEFVSDSLADGVEYDIYHIADGQAPELVDTVTAVGGAVGFEAESFSVYVVTDATFIRTYRFYTLDEYGEYTEYIFSTDSGESVSSQSITNGETLTVPANPVNPQDPTATFAGWFEDITPEGESTQVLASTAYDFNNIPEITQNEEVHLYAKFASFAYIIYHDQQGSLPDVTFSVVYTERVPLVGGSAEADISKRSVVYSGDNSMVFYGWSQAKISLPGSTHDDEGHIVKKEDDTITVTGTTHLYPIFKQVKWLSFVSGPAGTGATYYPETYYYDSLGPASLADRIPTRDGAYAFDGWYADSTLLSSGEVDPDNKGTKIANADGSLCPSTSATGISVDSSGNMTLTSNVTLYAVWTDITTANYTIVVVKQKATDSEGLPDNQKTYEYSESFLLSGLINQIVVVDSQYKALDNDDNYNALHTGANVSGTDNPYNNYQFNLTNSDSQKVIKADGSTVLYLRYDWITKPTITGSFSLTFADSVEAAGQASDSLPVAYNQDSGEYSKLPYGTALAGYVPSPDPDSGRDGYTFTGWFVDKACTTRAFFEAGDDYNNYSRNKALFDTMPGADMTFYAGWELEWYVVTIDPNYGAMYAYNGNTLEGTGSTWFWSAYGGQIQEYTTVTRDYVESDSGTWYYVNHAGDGFGGTLWPDRYTYYTQDPSEATEFTKFVREPGVYRYDGWYEVKPDGTEVPYDFNRIVTDNITIKLHWTKLGAYYINYVAGEGTLNGDDELEPVYVELDNDSYADNAEVVVTHSCDAPEGYEFVGWKIRGDQTQTIYRPGGTFTLLTSYAVTVQGKKTVYLDAVYTKHPNAKIVYDANGGVITQSQLDYGSIDDVSNPGSTIPLSGEYDSAENTVTVGGLVNNSKVYLADGSGFTMTDAEFVGWCNKPVYDPVNDSSAKLFLPGVQSTEVYNVNTNEPFTLYAVWAVDVNYHLNKDADANFGGDWSAEGYTKIDDVTYRKDAYLGSTLQWPPFDPVYTGSSPIVFRNWRTGPHADDDVYGFDTAVTRPLDLYAYWASPATVNIHAVDASGEIIADMDGDWLTTPFITVGPEQIDINTAFANTLCGNLPASNYTFAFAALSDSIANITEEPIASIKYSAEAGAVVVTFESGDSETLDGGSIYLVYYQTKSLGIGYLKAAAGGTLASVGVNNAPTSADLSAQYDMSAAVTAPMTYPTGGTYTYYSYAIGPAGAGNTAELTVLTAEKNSDEIRPSLLVRNTWRGFEYSTDSGTSWESCGYSPKLYTIYYESLPTVVTVSEKTFGKLSDMDEEFTYTVTVTQNGQASPVFQNSDTLKSGESKFMTLFYSPGQEQTLTVVQTENPSFTTSLSEASGLGTVDADARSWTYTTSAANDTPCVEFTNKHKSETITVHAARVEVTGGGIVLCDGWRSSAAEFTLSLDEEKEFRTELPGTVLVSGHPEYAMGAIFHGTDGGTDGSPVTPDGFSSVAAISYEPVEEGSNVYGLYLKDEAGEYGARQTELSGTSFNIYYLYYPKLTVHYLKESDNGALTPIEGASSGNITYNGTPLIMNGFPVVQKQKVEMPSGGLIISQTVGSSILNMPPLLDDGNNACDLVFSKIGVYTAETSDADPISNTSAAGANFSEELELILSIVDNQLKWSFDGINWKEFTNWPVVYAVYHERGYDLNITKTVPVDTGYKEPFTITVSSTAINRSSYAVEGTGSHTVTATPASGVTPGTITFTVTDGSSVKLIGLGAGTYTVTETGNDNFTLTAKLNNSDLSVANNSTVEDFDLNGEITLDLTNAPVPICRIGSREFYTISSAVEWIEQNAADFTGTIEMLVDYLMPSSDSPEISEYLNVTLTSIPGENKTITRKGTNTSGQMFNNSGVFTLQNVTIDGNGVSASGPVIANEGSLTIGTGAVLRNASNGGNGGAVNSSGGTVTIADGSSVTGNRAALGGAVYASGGTVVISGGSVRDNHAANGGAVYYAGSDTVTVSGGSVSENTAANGGAIYLHSGALTVSGGSMSQNSATSKGGAVFSENAVVNVSGGTIGGSGAGNTAANGGAVYSEAGTVNLSGGTISHNSASVNGGGINVNSAVISMTGGTLDSNTASSDGGAVYTVSGALSISNGTVSNNTATGNGGGVYAASGAVTLTNNTTLFSGNGAANGGAVFTGSGSLSANKVNFTNNNTASVNGGAVYIDSGSATFTNCTINGNSANNGAAVFDNTGTVTFSAGTVKNNTASNGGAVGVGSTTSRLNFSGNIQIINNTMGTAESNVFLDQDTDAVINASGLGSDAAIGIYVAGDVTADLFMHRGVPSARFGAYTSDSNITKFSNDRLSGLSVQKDTNSKKLFWGKSFTIEVRYLSNFTDFTSIEGTLKKVDSNNTISYFAPSSNCSASEIADDLRSHHTISDLAATASFAAAFVGNVSFNFADNIKDVTWDSINNQWSFIKRDGTSTTGNKLVVYYSEPTYISIENNTGSTLTVSSLTVLGQSAADTGYGYVFARNGVIQEKLYPIAAADLVLEAGRSIKLVFPGGGGTAYTFEGGFTGASEDITYTLTGGAGNPYTLEQTDSASFTLPKSGQPATLSTSGGTYEIIFGGKKAICKIVSSADASSGFE
ncbi:MAG: InlB B-repeat-containing protein, partial [Oscillospiraceae bacterium]|nr:InlB B-repeat-containing protein [Oscillospiraceae bacterium]